MNSYNNIYKPFEEVIAGYYDFGNNYFVNLDKAIKHRSFIAIHERTHINIGSSTNMGMYQQLLHSVLMHDKFVKFPVIFQQMHNICLDEIRIVHEAAATYEEFCAARFQNYDGLEEMESSLPDEYKDYLSVFDSYFTDEFPLGSRRILGYHLARFAMNNSILTDYCQINDTNIETFEDYIQSTNISPRSRLTSIMNGIEDYGKTLFFKEYLECYEENSAQLYKAYEDRTIDNRKKTLSIQCKFLRILNLSVIKLNTILPNIIDDSITAVNLVKNANNTITHWKKYLADKGYTKHFELRFLDTDGSDVDIIDNQRVYLTNRSPQSGLYPLKHNPNLLPTSSCFSRIWIHKDKDRLPLNDSKTLYLTKGDIYIRLLHEQNIGICAYAISDKTKNISDIINKYSKTVLMDGVDYINETAKSLINTCNSINYIVRWASIAHFIDNYKLSNEIKYRIIHLQEVGVSLFLVNDTGNIYHVLLAAIETDFSLILNELSYNATYVDFTLNIEPILSDLRIINARFHMLF